MDQQKMLRLLRLLMLLAGNRRYSVKEMKSNLDISQRSAYRYLETFELAGFVLDKNLATYRLQQNNSNTKTLQKLMHFSEEEVLILYDTLSLIEGTSAVKEQLIRKLNVLYDYKALEQLQQNDDLTKIHVLSDAIRNKKQVNLKGYRSSNSDQITDRKVEPFDYLPDYRAVWCYEYKSESCKQFKLARIQEIELINREWENEQQHTTHFTDAIRVSSLKPIEKIQASLSMKAYNLLLEEFPLCREFITQKDSRYWNNWIEEAIENNNQKIEVLCYNLCDEFDEKKKNKQYIEANQLLVQVYRYELGKYEPDKTRNVVVEYNLVYDSIIGYSKKGDHLRTGVFRNGTDYKLLYTFED